MGEDDRRELGAAGPRRGWSPHLPPTCAVLLARLLLLSVLRVLSCRVGPTVPPPSPEPWAPGAVTGLQPERSAPLPHGGLRVLAVVTGDSLVPPLDNHRVREPSTVPGTGSRGDQMI